MASGPADVQVSRLQLSEEGLTRLLARAQATEEELRRDLARAAAREDALAQQLAHAKVDLADNASVMEELHSKISELEHALVRMATAEDESAELRSQVTVLEQALAQTSARGSADLAVEHSSARATAQSDSKVCMFDVAAISQSAGVSAACLPYLLLLYVPS